MFFAIYEEEQIDKNTGEPIIVRTFDTIPLNVVIDRQKRGLPPAPKNENGMAPKYVLSPNDLVYVPTTGEIECGKLNIPLDNNRIYKMVSANKKQAFFISSKVASTIVDKFEFSPLNKQERALTGEMIKEVCIPVFVNRIGEIILRK